MIVAGYFILLIALSVFTYGFVDLNLHLTDATWFTAIQKPLSDLVYHNMRWAGVIFTLLVLGLYGFYFLFFQSDKNSLRKIIQMKTSLFIFITGAILLFSFPAFTYDIFNYMTTARVVYTHKENPYIVRPIDIPNEPGLAYTRAANKIALYGPTWLLLTGIPHALGLGNTWLTIIHFKLLVIIFYFLLVLLIYRETNNWKNVLFFALNPLVLIEILVSGHNDVVMMVPALVALGVGKSSGPLNKLVQFVLWVASVGAKGATAVLLPLAFWKPHNRQLVYRLSYWIMFTVFIIAAPVREELYPWYAIWFLPFAAFLPVSRRSFIHGFSVALCLGLTFRHLPYILTREYGGIGPVLRIFSTVIPPGAYIAWYIRSYGVNRLARSAFYGKN